MIITCNSCGKKYKIDPAKMKKTSVTIKCKACNNPMTIEKPKPEPPPEVEFDILPDDAITEVIEDRPIFQPVSDPTPQPKPAPPPKKKSGMRIFLLLVLLLVILGGAGYYYWQFMMP